MILGGILAEVFHGIDDLGAVLHLVKNDQGLFRNDFLPTGQHQILQDAVNILGGFKKLLVLLVFVEVKIGCIFIVAPTKLFQYPGFPHLAHPLQYQGLAVWRILPVQQLLQYSPFHGCPPHIFIELSVDIITLLLYAMSHQKTTPFTKLL